MRFASLPRRLTLLLAVPAGVAAIAIGAELAMRAATHAFGKCHPICIVEYDATLGWTNARGAVGRHREPALGIDVVYRIDARGARTASVEPPRPGVPRIVVIGDSNGFGWGVADDRHFAALLSRTGVTEVLNLSVSGYGTDQSLLRFVADGLAFDPHMVVLQVTPNDFDDIQETTIAGRPKPRFQLGDRNLLVHHAPGSGDSSLLIGGSVLPLAARGWLTRHCYIYAWLNERNSRALAPATVRPPRFSPASVALFRALVERIRDVAAANGAAVLLMHASTELRERRDEAIPPRVHTLDLSERFRDEGPALFPDDLHWNERGHRLAAEGLAQWIIDHDLNTTSTAQRRDATTVR